MEKNARGMLIGLGFCGRASRRERSDGLANIIAWKKDGDVVLAREVGKHDPVCFARV